MYHCKLIVQIFSHDDLLLRQIQASAPLERFEHEVRMAPSFSQDLLQQADVVIWDLPLLLEPCALRAACKKNAVLILCADGKQRLDLPLSSCRAFDDVWEKPFSPDFILFKYEKLQAAIKLRKDYHLTCNYLDTTIDSIPDLIWYKDVRGAHLKVNNGFCHSVGKTKQQVEGRGHYYIWDLKKEEYEKGEFVCLETDEMVLTARKTCLFDEKVKSKYGMRQFKTYKSPLFDDDGKIMGTVGIAHDVTDLQNMDAELEIILRSMPFAVLVKDETGRIVKTNEKFEEYFQVKACDIIGRHYEAWRNCDVNRPQGKGVNVVPGGERDSEFILYSNGKKRFIDVHEEPIFDIFRHCVGQLCIYRDVTIEKTFEKQMLHNANTDALTGLYNRRYFYEYMEKNRGDRKIALLYVDLDNFKQINDTYGHQLGDEVLIMVSRLIQSVFPDDLTARVGGDEFLIAVVGECEQQQIEDKAGRLLASMQSMFAASKRLKDLSVSIGIALGADSKMKIDEVIKLSDIALYISKHRGKAQYCVYTPELQTC